MALFAIFTFFAVGRIPLAYGQGDTVGQDQLEKELGSARLTDTIAGSALALHARMWRNLMPGPEARSAEVRIAATVDILGGAHPGDIAVTRLWVLSSGGKPVEASIAWRLATHGGLRVVATASVPTGLVAGVWVVAEATDSAGGQRFIRSPGTNIEEAR